MPATIATLAEPLGEGCEGRWDRKNAVILEAGIGEFASSSDLQFFNGANLAAVEAGENQWEVLQFKQAELLSDGRWKLSNLLRGQLGTSELAGITKPTGSRFVLLDDSIAQIPMNVAERGLPLNWLVGPSDDPYGSATYSNTSFTFAGKSFVPFGPVHLKGEQTPSGDWEFTWIRRSRLEGDSWEGVEIPLGEEAEMYEISISDANGNLKRQCTITNANAHYSSAEFTADFPIVPDTFRVRVSQLGTYGQKSPPAFAEIQIP